MPKEKGGKKNKAEHVEKAALEKTAPIIEARGYEVWDVIFEKEGAMWYLKVLFDKPDGGLDDEECEEITKPINDAVDTLPCLDLIDVVEVGSPGLNRWLRKPFHFEKSIGEPVRVNFRDENGRHTHFCGTLTAYDPQKGSITVNGEKETVFETEKCERIILDL